MNLQIELSPDDEARLEAAARAKGLHPSELARQILNEHLPPVLRSQEEARDRTLELFAQWEAEDATDDPEEIARRIQEWEELKAGLNANRAATGERLLFP